MAGDNDMFVGLIREVAIKYLGEPNSRLSDAAELRFGTSGSMSADLIKGTWFSHEEQKGGGVIDLIRRFNPDGNIPDILERDFGVSKSPAPLRLVLPVQDKPAEIKLYDYTDAEGVIQYQIERRQMSDGSKRFLQRKIDQETGRPIYKMDGVTQLPYNLAAIAKSKDPVFVVEGEKCADAINSLGLIATTNSGGAKAWKPELNHHLANRVVIIIPDNDPPGEAHLRHVAEQLTGTVKQIRVLRLPDLKLKGDVVEWLDAGGTVEQLRELAKASPHWSKDQPEIIHIPEAPANLFQLIHFDDLPEVTIKWLIKDLLPAQGFHSIFGQSGTYKSFLALYLSAMIASGRDAFGKPVEQGAVIYIAGEGKAGLKARRDALAKHYELAPGTPIYFLPDQLNLRSTAEDMLKLVATIQASNINPALIVVDTLNRAFSGGNENNSDDMGNFIQLVGQIQARLETAVLIIHHSGKDEAKGARGHSSLRAALDSEIEVTKLNDYDDADRRGSMTITKQKDGEDGGSLFYDLQLIELSAGGVVTRQDAVTSLVVVPSEGSETVEAKPQRLGADGKRVMEALEMAVGEVGESVGLPVIPAGTKAVRYDLLRQYFNQNCPLAPETKRVAWNRGVKDAVAKRSMGYSEPYYWIIQGNQ